MRPEYNWAEYPQPLHTQEHNPTTQEAPVAQPVLGLAEAEQKPASTICGLPKKIFWGLTAVAFVVVLASIGAGLAARFAGNKGHSSNASAPAKESVVQSVYVVISNGITSTLPVETKTVSMTITSASTARATSSPNPCISTQAFTSGLFWMGTESQGAANPMQLFWVYNLNSAQACCERCFNLQDTGGKCNVWGYFSPPYGAYGNNKDSCAIIWGYEGPSKDETCPTGRPPIGLLKPTGRQTKDANGIGAPGPCGGSIYTFTTAGQ